MDIDEQVRGGFHDSFEILNFENSDDCDSFYDILKDVFYNVGSWGNLFGKGTEFHTVSVQVENNDYELLSKKLVKIKIPGLKNNLGNGFDWVEIHQSEFYLNIDHVAISFSLSPCRMPGNNFTTHFFESESKNYFIIKKYLTFITAEVHGRNEIPNLENLPTYNKVRNYIMAKGGLFGMSKIQWQTWCENILKVEYLNKCSK